MDREKEQEKQRVRNAAFMVAEYEHGDDPAVKKCREAVDKIKGEIQKAEANRRELNKKHGDAMAALSEALEKYIPKALRKDAKDDG